MQLAAHICKFPCCARPSLLDGYCLHLPEMRLYPTFQKLEPSLKSLWGKRIPGIFFPLPLSSEVKLPVFPQVEVQAPLYISRLTSDPGKGLMTFTFRPGLSQSKVPKCIFHHIKSGHPSRDLYPVFSTQFRGQERALALSWDREALSCAKSCTWIARTSHPSSGTTTYLLAPQ